MSSLGQRPRRIYDRGTLTFWGTIILLFGLSAFFGVNAEHQRRAVQSAGGTIENGDLVRFVKVIDGDAVLMAREGQEPVTVRLLGIKSFDAKLEKDVASIFAQGAVSALQRTLADRPVRVMLNVPPKDKYSRYLATLYADDEDVAIHLIRQGLVLVYTVYPFPALPLYLKEQDLARTAHRGLWGNPEATAQARALFQEWRAETK